MQVHTDIWIYKFYLRSIRIKNTCPRFSAVLEVSTDIILFLSKTKQTADIVIFLYRYKQHN